MGEAGLPAEGDTKLGEYLMQLAEQPKLVQEFLANPERAMRDAGVGRAERDLVLSGNVEGVRKTVQEEFADQATALMFMVWIPRPPGPHMVW